MAVVSIKNGILCTKSGTCFSENRLCEIHKNKRFLTLLVFVPGIAKVRERRSQAHSKIQQISAGTFNKERLMVGTIGNDDLFLGFTKFGLFILT